MLVFLICCDILFFQVLFLVIKCQPLLIFTVIIFLSNVLLLFYTIVVVNTPAVDFGCFFHCIHIYYGHMCLFFTVAYLPCITFTTVLCNFYFCFPYIPLGFCPCSRPSKVDYFPNCVQNLLFSPWSLFSNSCQYLYPIPFQRGLIISIRSLMI